MIYQVIDPADDRFRMWTGSATCAISQHGELERCGRTAVVADHRGRRLSASDLVDCATRENERHAAASLQAFRRRMEAADTLEPR